MAEVHAQLEGQPVDAVHAESDAHASSTRAELLDPRIRRTRELLQQALSRLMEARDFERISVQEITDAAGVNRATFYAHYTDKFALLECLVAGRFHGLLAQRGIAFTAGCDQALLGLTLGVCDFLAREHEPIAGSGSTSQPRTIQPHMETAVVSVLRGMILDGFERHQAELGSPSGITASPCDARRLRAAAVSWAIYGAAREWVSMPHRIASEQVAADVVALISPLLHPAS